jgi:hypothetical protein
MPTLNPSEAPSGFYAVLKSDITRQSSANICNSCDWRVQCNDPNTDFTKNNHRCMSYGIIHAKTGNVIKRNDGCGVVFKRLI